MNADSIMAALFAGSIGFMCSQMLKSYQQMKRHKETKQAISNLRSKGFNLTFDKLDGMDELTQREMELVRSAGYTVVDQDGKPIGFKVQ